MAKNLKSNKGVALILTIAIIGLIVTLSLGFNLLMRSELNITTRIEENMNLTLVARSCIDFSLAVLFEDMGKNDIDSLMDSWANSEDLSSAISSLFGENNIEIRIEDLSGRIQINSLTNQDGQYNILRKDILMRLLRSPLFNLNPEDVEDITDSIKDWIDKDDDVTRFGAESSYYNDLDHPYACRNGPIKSLEELLFIKGISNELYNSSDNSEGLSAYLTEKGNGKININTAPPAILLCLSEEIDGDMIEGMLAYREEEENDLKDIHWYKNVPGMSHITINPELISISSDYFKITAAVVKGTVRKEISTIVERKSNGIRILSWQII